MRHVRDKNSKKMSTTFELNIELKVLKFFYVFDLVH